MLLRFEVSNHRSIMEPVELSMIAVDEDRPATRSFDRLSEQVLTVAGIYGPNASGKSNVVHALSWLCGAVGNSLRRWDDTVPREPFRFAPGPSTPSTYEIELMVDDVRHTYRVEVEDEAVVYESLHSYPAQRRRVLFERDGMTLTFRRGLAGASGTHELLTPTTLALSAAARLDQAESRSVSRQIGAIRPLGTARSWSRSYSSSAWAARLFEADVDERPAAPTDELSDQRMQDRESALALLRFADLGIDDVQVTEHVIDDADLPDELRGRQRRRSEMHLIHRVAGEDLAFTLADESAGTQTWLGLIGPVLDVLKRGNTLVADEVDASLHPRLTARLLNLFHDPDTNPKGAQLIFTAHDTSLLNHLNRDEVWLTEKGDDGATTLTALAEFGGDKVRRSLNLENAYLRGRFGAVPDPDQALIYRALGLSTE